MSARSPAAGMNQVIATRNDADLAGIVDPHPRGGGGAVTHAGATSLLADAVEHRAAP